MTPDRRHGGARCAHSSQLTPELLLLTVQLQLLLPHSCASSASCALTGAANVQLERDLPVRAGRIHTHCRPKVATAPGRECLLIRLAVLSFHVQKGIH